MLPVETALTEALPAPEPPETVEEAKKELTFQPEKEHFGVLVAKFRKYQEASKLMAQLRRQGKPTWIRPSPGEPTRYEVWVAPYEKEEPAQSAAKSIKAKYGRSAQAKN
ncbi:MAG: SPOR domain-containing protein [Deltaproteobacteria bacterium]|nr:SPOR domain-containing protein [Deltaproteobacteria bacterium]MBW1952911.1 SPOR domain-containing protein [Deltaproteobacteria bacterium]MBW1987145.1 SPOR domain-containing protein [Deltaproteobacteria bacterium]MBW2135357.1 SPOR domain-containing protein [Deltaproteobacteria bacterium]